MAKEFMDQIRLISKLKVSRMPDVLCGMEHLEGEGIQELSRSYQSHNWPQSPASLSLETHGDIS